TPSSATPAAAFLCRSAEDGVRRMGDNRCVAGGCSALRESGFVWIRSALAAPAAAFDKTLELIEECTVWTAISRAAWHVLSRRRPAGRGSRASSRLLAFAVGRS